MARAGRVGLLLFGLMLGAVAGCGSRSALFSAADGSGGSAASSGSGGAGGFGAVAGTGGGSVGCAAWEQTASYTFEAFSDVSAEQPRLLAIDSAEQSVVVSTIGSSGGWPLRYFHGGLDPWGAPIGANVEFPGTFLYHLEYRAYAVGRSRVDEAYALLLSVTVPPGLVLDPEVVPGTSEPGIELPYPLGKPGEMRPLFVARRAGTIGAGFEHLLGSELFLSDRRRLVVRLVSDTWSDIEHSQAVACANRDLVADAESVDSTFYVATASSRPLGQCDDPADAFAVPNRVMIVSYNQPVGIVLSSVYENPTNEIGGIDLVTDTAGIWLVYAERTAPDRAALRAVRLGFAGEWMAGPVPFGDLPWPPSFSASRRGNDLLVAALERTPDGQTIVPVRTVSPDGSLEQFLTIVPNAANGVALLGAPTGNAFVVALTRENATPATQDPVLLLRYGCP